MLYNLKNARHLNFDLVELEALANNPADIIMLLYLHFTFNKSVAKLNTMVKEFNLDDYPSLDYTFYTGKDYKKNIRYSIFKTSESISKLIYKDILKAKISDRDKITYLQYVSLIPPYNANKFLPDNYFNKVPRSLSLLGLVKTVHNGVILTKER